MRTVNLRFGSLYATPAVGLKGKFREEGDPVYVSLRALSARERTLAARNQTGPPGGERDDMVFTGGHDRFYETLSSGNRAIQDLSEQLLALEDIPDGTLRASLKQAIEEDPEFNGRRLWRDNILALLEGGQMVLELVTKKPKQKEAKTQQLRYVPDEGWKIPGTRVNLPYFQKGCRSEYELVRAELKFIEPDAVAPGAVAADD